MASTVTTIIQSARLFEQVRRRNQALGVLVRMAREMVAAEDVDRLLEGAAQALHEDMGYHYASMHLVDAEAELVRLTAQAGPESSEMVGGFTQRIGVGLAGLAAERGELIVSKDATNDPRVLHLPGFQIGSEVSVPLVSRGQVLGVLNVHAKQPNGFDESDMHFLETLAGQLGAALSRARRAEQLREAYQALQEADRLKEEMLQNVSHELRTPLTYITGYTDLLLEGEMGELNADQHEGLQVVFAKAQTLARLVNDIITLQTVEGGDVHYEHFGLPDLLREAATSSEIVARTAGVELVLDVAPDLPDVRADRLRIGQVLDNLLENAIKFSPGGGQVTVRARMEGAEVYVAVSDTGIGIPPDELERIFERFYQVSAGPARRFGGVGLGLSICKTIVEAHRGRIWAESTPGQGSTFTFTLPLEE
jgi:signal transduction histidine kinase